MGEVQKSRQTGGGLGEVQAHWVIRILTIQTLNALYNDVFAPLAVSIAGFSIGNGIAIVTSRVLPPWVGCLGIAIGLISLTPAGLVGFLGLGVWILIVSILLMAEG